MTSEQIKQLLNAVFKPELLKSLIIALLMQDMPVQKAAVATIMSLLSQRLLKENRWSSDIS